VIKIIEAKFLTGSASPADWPDSSLPEVAFVGRSNVGKSSMINSLAGRRKLVRVSKTPGRTRMINYFEIALQTNGTAHRLRVVDLPGYGFARVAKSERDRWDDMISNYLEKRQNLQVVVSIIDAEIGPTDADQQMLEYLSELRPGVLVVATKIDRLPKARRKPRWKEIAAQLGLSPDRVVPFSAVEGIGAEEVWEALLQTVRGGRASG
jgi:GTP-binding protein